MKLWLFWSIDVLISAIIVVFFFFGIVDGTVSTFNIGIWIAIFAALAVIIGGSLGLKMLGYPVLGMLLLLVLAISGLFYGLFMSLILITNTSWNRGWINSPVPESFSILTGIM